MVPASEFFRHYEILFLKLFEPKVPRLIFSRNKAEQSLEGPFFGFVRFLKQNSIYTKLCIYTTKICSS